MAPVVELWLEAEPPRQEAEHLGVRFRLARRRDRGLVNLDVEVAVRAVNVEVFQLGRRGQQDVGVICRVGLELLVDDREKVFAAQPAHPPVAAVDEQARLLRGDPGPPGDEEVADLASAVHAYDATRAAAEKGGPAVTWIGRYCLIAAGPT